MWCKDLKMINEETLKHVEIFDGDVSDCVSN